MINILLLLSFRVIHTLLYGVIECDICHILFAWLFFSFAWQNRLVIFFSTFISLLNLHERLNCSLTPVFLSYNSFLNSLIFVHMFALAGEWRVVVFIIFFVFTLQYATMLWKVLLMLLHIRVSSGSSKASWTISFSTLACTKVCWPMITYRHVVCGIP